MEPDLILSASELHLLESRTALIPRDDAVFHLAGPGAVDCRQGVLTNDLVRPGAEALVWGALLTPKGMIISDAWVRRRGAEAWVIVPGAARERIQQLFTRSFPPRLAKVRDVTDSCSVRWLTCGSPEAMEGADLVHPSGPAPFAALLLTEHSARDDAYLQEAGWRTVPAAWADALKLLEGWPSLNREIDDKTLPQEVRFDELEGVRYDKGCYTGQETVARLHFRGHANRSLRGLRWRGDDGPVDRTVRVAERDVGSVRTLARFDTTWYALALLRREVAVGDVVSAGGVDAVVVELPFNGTPRESA